MDRTDQHLKLADALDLAGAPATESSQPRPLWLICGFTPLHLVTYLKARGRGRYPGGLDILTGVFGDLPGNVHRASERPVAEAAVVVEWSDLDPRLGLRHAGGWGPSVTADIEAEVGKQLDRIRNALAGLARSSTVALCGPTLPLPPIGHTGEAQETPFELRLRAAADRFLADAAEIARVRVVSPARIDIESPLRDRLDAGMALATGFPYTLPHTDTLAILLTQVLFPAQPRKGLITDLDDTFWRGIVGEIGVDTVAWDLQGHAQHHGLYQQFLAALAERGVLVAIASKNDPALVAEALRRSDVLVPASALFPVEVNWGAKSASVGRILEAWNIGASDVVFVDDSAMEAAEVQAAFPEITCVAFPRAQAGKVIDLLSRLRSLFGKQELLEEDRLRVASLRTAEQFRQEGVATASEEFLGQLGATLIVDFTKRPSDSRALELINKTNQFNLNGRRFTEGEWLAHLANNNSFMVTLSYEDKFGPLGKIAVVTGVWDGTVPHVLSWVMSCRAFSRRIEHHTLERLFARFEAKRIDFAYQPTERNGPLRDFFQPFVKLPDSAATISVTNADFEERRAVLPHAVKEITNGSDRSAPAKVLLEGVS